MSAERDWRYPEDARDPGARLFKQVENCLRLIHSDSHIVGWKQYFKPTKKMRMGIG